jgi:putative acetyltransferase
VTFALRSAAGPADFAAVAGFMAALRDLDAAECAARGFDPAEVHALHGDRSAAALARAFAAKGTALLVAEAGGRIAGCGGFRTAGPGLAELAHVWVDPEVRGRGLGDALVGAVLARAAAQGLPAARLETGRFLAAAIRLYRRHGFADCPPFRPLTARIDSLSLFMQRPAGG